MSVSGVLGVVHAKSSSSRVQGKNAQEVGGLPLYLNALLKLRSAGISSVYLDSDDEGFLARAQAEGFLVHRRDINLATNSTNGHDLLWEFSKEHRAMTYVQLSSTAPFISTSTIMNALRASQKNSSTAFLLTRRREYEWIERLGTISPAYDWRKLPNSIDLKARIDEVTGLYVVPDAVLQNERTRIAPGGVGIVVSSIEAMDINVPEDLSLARVLADQHPEWLRGEGIEASKQEELSWKSRKKVKLLISDVDGTLTPGTMTYTEHGQVSRDFSVRDGEALNLLSAIGIHIVFASGSMYTGSSKFRAEQLGIRFQSFGQDKSQDFISLVQELGFQFEEVCYVGDSPTDVECLKLAGLAVVPSDASARAKEVADWILEARGGSGVLMEIFELLAEWGQ